MRAILLAAFLLSATPALAADYTLIITYVTGQNEQNIQQAFKEESLEQCWLDAKIFVDHQVPEAVADKVYGVVGACMRGTAPEHKS